MLDQTGRSGPIKANLPILGLLALRLSLPAYADLLQVNDANVAARVAQQGGRLIADYGKYQLFESGKVETAWVATGQVAGREEYHFIRLNAGPLDTRKPEIKALRAAVGNFEGKRLHLLQFAGPAQAAWREELLATGVQVMAYIPHNSYLIYGDAPSLGRLQRVAASAAHVQWEAAYLDDYKIHPAARNRDGQGNVRQIGTDLFSIQLVADPVANGETIELLQQLKLEPFRRPHLVLGYLNLLARLAAESLEGIAAQPDVISIRP